MTYRFKQSVILNGITFKCGEVCEVSKEVENHPFFLKLAEAGLVYEDKIEVPVVRQQDQPAELAKKLADRLKATPPEAEEEKPKKKRG